MLPPIRIHWTTNKKNDQHKFRSPWALLAAAAWRGYCVTCLAYVDGVNAWFVLMGVNCIPKEPVLRRNKRNSTNYYGPGRQTTFLHLVCLHIIMQSLILHNYEMHMQHVPSFANSGTVQFWTQWPFFFDSRLFLSPCSSCGSFKRESTQERFIVENPTLFCQCCRPVCVRCHAKHNKCRCVSPHASCGLFFSFILNVCHRYALFQFFHITACPHQHSHIWVLRSPSSYYAVYLHSEGEKERRVSQANIYRVINPIVVW